MDFNRLKKLLVHFVQSYFFITQQYNFALCNIYLDAEYMARCVRLALFLLSDGKYLWW